MADITLKGVSFSYPGGIRAVDNVSLTIRAGEKVAVTGQNGAGKTTMAKLMNGLLRPAAGDVAAGAMNTKNCTAASVSRIVGYVFQNPDDQIFHSTVEAEVRFGPSKMKLPAGETDLRVNAALAMTDMERYRDENPLNLPLSTRKFVTVASVLAMDTEVIIFDEPTAGQDLKGLRLLSGIINKLHEQRKTVISISHDMEFVGENFDRVLVMTGGKIIRDGAPGEILKDPGILEKAGLRQTCVCRICGALGIEEVLSVDEAADRIIKLRTELSGSGRISEF